MHETGGISTRGMCIPEHLANALNKSIYKWIYKWSYLSEIAAETIETWYTHSSKGDTPTDIINLCFHGSTHYLSEFQPKKIKGGQVIYLTRLYTC